MSKQINCVHCDQPVREVLTTEGWAWQHVPEFAGAARNQRDHPAQPGRPDITMPNMATELRDAREELATLGGDLMYLRHRLTQAEAVVKAVRGVMSPGLPSDRSWTKLRGALAAYDQVAGTEVRS